MKKSILLVLLALSFNCFSQTNFYVDKNLGSDINNGSLATPWKTIQKAANTAIPNSIVHIKAGTYYENVEVNVTGTLGNYIVFKNYLNDVVQIDGAGTAGSTLLTVTNKSYLKFENFTVQNKTINDAQGILVETTGASSSTDLTFTNIKIQNINWTNNANAVANDTKNAQGFIAYGRDGGITNLTVTNCEVFNTILGYSEALAINGNIDGFTVANCMVHDNTNIGIVVIGHEGTAFPAAIDEARNGTVSNNTCYNNVSNYATSAGIYVDGASAIVVEKNTCYKNGWGIEIGAEQNGIVQQVIVKNNLIYNNQQAGLAIGGYNTATTGQVTNCMVRNNTFLQNNSLNDGTGELAITKVSNCRFENNIFYTNAQNVLMSVENIAPQTNNTFNYNCWYTPNNNASDITVNWRTATYASFASYQSSTLQDNTSTYSDPNLTSLTLTAPDLRLLAASSCIDAGNPITVIAGNETDFVGNSRIANTVIDKGAYEYSSALGLKETTNLLCAIYPNPSTGSLTIELDGLLREAEVTIADGVGKTFSKHTISNYSSTLNLSDLENGIYFVEIKHSLCRTIYKIIVQK